MRNQFQTTGFGRFGKTLIGCLLVVIAWASTGQANQSAADTGPGGTVESRKGSWFWLEKQSTNGDMWAKYFLARAHLHAMHNEKERHVNETFAELGLPEEAQPYWNAYQDILRIKEFAGSNQDFLELTLAGLKARFKPLISLREERDKSRPLQSDLEFEYGRGTGLENLGNLLQFPSSEMRASSGHGATLAGLEGRYAVKGHLHIGKVVQPISTPGLELKFIPKTMGTYQLEYWNGYSPIAYFDVRFFPFTTQQENKQPQGDSYLGIVCPSEALGTENRWGNPYIPYLTAGRCFFIVLHYQLTGRSGQFHFLRIDRASKEQHLQLSAAVQSANGVIKLDKRTIPNTSLLLVQGISDPAMWMAFFQDSRVNLTQAFKEEYVFTPYPEDLITTEAHDHVEKGEQFFKEKNYMAAVGEFVKAIQLIPTADNPLTRRANVGGAAAYYEMKEYDRVIDHAAAAIRGGSKDRNLFLFSGIAYWHKGLPMNAQTSLNQAYAIDQTDSLTNYMLAAVEISYPWINSKDIYARFIRAEQHCRQSGGGGKEEEWVTECLEMVRPLHEEYDKQVREVGMRGTEPNLLSKIGPRMSGDTLLELIGLALVVSVMQSALGSHDVESNGYSLPQAPNRPKIQSCTKTCIKTPGRTGTTCTTSCSLPF